ncbi:hypothetical protein HNQ79_006788 [Streptomyces candidus]|uniref:Uncharacterized protein n=1 Tax=Streptomyces candidus TaxID=67283 RepID=A0A7X0HQ00_9ACTN|nr:hypothetical protein [Streptomyces candidus]MBB6440273.1 hypothetical protein [Streptomyces candidus]GHH55954.1 hypothetical protein GCM10018773_61100 [Streptomyces candidus]
MASVLGLLEARERAARERVEDLREAAARAAAALEAAEVEWDRRVIAREELVDALAESAEEATAAVETEGEDLPAPVLASVPGAVVPPWREGLSVAVLSLDNQRILNVLQDRPGHEPVRAKGIAAALGIDNAVAAKVEGVRSKAKRLGERGWLLQEASGAFSAGRRLVAGPGGGSSA